MKKILIVAVAFASVNAFASRARVTALGNSPHLVDTQTVYSNPADMMVLADYVNFESGTTAGGTGTNYAEGMITRSMGESKFGLGVGHQNQNASTWGLRNAGLTGIARIKGQQNPIYLAYGWKMDDMLLGASLVYSNYADKVTATEEKESSAGLRLGLRTGAWDAKVAIGLMNSYEDVNADEKFTGTGGISAAVGYAMDDMYYSLAVDQAGFKTEAAGVDGTSEDRMNLSLGALQSLKQDGSELFWGAALAYGTIKREVPPADAVTTTTMSLPITVGMEVDAASWMTFRGSITQPVIIHSTKNDADPVTVDLNPGLNATSVAAGVGIKHDKLTIDATLTGFNQATQDINGNNLLGMVGVTYLY